MRFRDFFERQSLAVPTAPGQPQQFMPVEHVPVMVGDNFIMIGVMHGITIILPPKKELQIIEKAQQLTSKGVWFEGDFAEPPVEKFAQKHLGNITMKSFEPSAETMRAKAPFTQHYTLFGGNPANVSHNIQSTGYDASKTILDNLLLMQKNWQGWGTAKPNELLKMIKMSLHPSSQQAAPNARQLLKLAHSIATPENLQKFLELGYKIMWPSNWQSGENPMNRMALSANRVRDEHIANIIKDNGGVYFIGSSHIELISPILKKMGIPLRIY